jgi:hypothetical protein
MQSRLKSWAVLPTACCLLAVGCNKESVGTPVPWRPWSEIEIQLRCQGELILPKPIPEGPCRLGIPVVGGVRADGSGAELAGSFANQKTGTVAFSCPARTNQYSVAYPVTFEDGRLFVAAFYHNHSTSWSEVEAKLRAEGEVVLSDPAPQGECVLGGVAANFAEGTEAKGKVYRDPIDPKFVSGRPYQFPSRPGFGCKIYAVRNNADWSVIAAAVYVPVRVTSNTIEPNKDKP